MAKLDTLMNQVGELVVARIAADQQLGQLRSLGQDLAQWELAWRAARPGRRPPDAVPLARFVEAGATHLSGIRRQVELSRGSLVVVATQREGVLQVEVSDDGAGIDPHRVRAKALERGLLTAESAERADDRGVLDLVFRSGFSTASTVTGLSGRGVGLDVVREHVERLQGTISLNTEVGRGTSFRLELPLTVATTLCLLVSAGGRPFGLPVTNVVRIARVREADMGSPACSVPARSV